MRKLRSGMLVCFVICATGVSMLLTGCGGGGDSKEKTETKAAEVAPMPSIKPITEERTYYGFEEDLAGWEVPAWAASKSDYVATDLVLSQDFASEGASSMCATVGFPGDSWSAGLIEVQQYLDLSAYRVLSTDVYLPADAPEGLKAKLVLTFGNNWKFVEMNQSIPLTPGQWTTITASVEPGSYDWKRVVPDEEFAKDIRKIAIRIVSNRKTKYAGPVYVDNVRVGR